jgi:hypothetical protein
MLSRTARNSLQLRKLLLLRWHPLLLIRLLLGLLLRRDDSPGNLAGLDSRTKWRPALLGRLVRIRRSRLARLLATGWSGRRRRRWWRGRFSASRIDRGKFVRRQAQGARGYEDEQFRLLNVGRILARQ